MENIDAVVLTADTLVRLFVIKTIDLIPIALLFGPLLWLHARWSKKK